MTLRTETDAREFDRRMEAALRNAPVARSRAFHLFLFGRTKVHRSLG